MTQIQPINVDGTSRAVGATQTRPCQITTKDEQDFHLAMEAYKQASGRMFPTWSEIFEILQSLGYKKRIWKPVPMPMATLPVASYCDPGLDSPMLLWFGQVETASIL